MNEQIEREAWRQWWGPVARHFPESLDIGGVEQSSWEAWKARAAIQALAPVPAAPEGWQLVPDELTREMWAAVNKVDDSAFAGGSMHGADFESLWDAALSEAPQPAQQAAQQEPAPEQGEPFGYVYSWIHSSATGRPDETYTSFSKSLDDAQRHPANFDIRAVYTHPQQPLTEEQVFASDEIMECNAHIGSPMHELMRLVRAIERTKKIGGAQ